MKLRVEIRVIGIGLTPKLQKHPLMGRVLIHQMKLSGSLFWLESHFFRRFRVRGGRKRGQPLESGK